MKKKNEKGGPGSGPHPGHSAATARDHNPMASVGKPNNGYSERPASHNAGKPRSGVRPADLYPERAKPKT